MTKPIPDKAEVALEYPDKLYIGTFERTARFDAHLDENGIRSACIPMRRTVRLRDGAEALYRALDTPA